MPVKLGLPKDTQVMKKREITTPELYGTGGVSKQAVYKAIRGGKLTFKDGKADVISLLAEWDRKRDPTRADRIGPALRRLVQERGLAMPSEKKPKRPAVPDEPAAVDAHGAPAHLSTEMRRFWRSVNSEYELEDDALLILKTGCEAYDRAQQARVLIASDGLILNGRRHPAIDVEAQAQSLFLRSMRQLALDVVDPGPIGRPVGK
jgi:phage terminase small subunit